MNYVSNNFYISKYAVNVAQYETFVKTKVALEELDEGQILQVHLNDGEPVQNVPRSIKDEGHEVLKLYDNGDGTFDLYIKKVGD